MVKPEWPWAVLGLHGGDAATGRRPDTARVRYFLNAEDDQVHVDEDVPLPEMVPEIPRTEAVYIALLRSTLDGRWRSLTAI